MFKFQFNFDFVEVYCVCEFFFWFFGDDIEIEDLIDGREEFGIRDDDQEWLVGKIMLFIVWFCFMSVWNVDGELIIYFGIDVKYECVKIYFVILIVFGKLYFQEFFFFIVFFDCCQSEF